MGLFGESDVADINSNPFHVDPGTYECTITESVIRSKKDDVEKRGLSLTYTITEEGEFQDSTVQEWKNIIDTPRDEQTNAERRQQSFLKQRLEQFGLSDEQMAKLDDTNIDDLEGIEGFVTVAETPDRNDPSIVYTNVRSFSLDG